MKISFAIAAVLLLVALFQPWSYDHRGFADAVVAVPDGEIDLHLDDHAGGKSYCLSSTFKTKDEPGKAVAINIDGIRTHSVPELASHIEKTGTTVRIEGLENPSSYFEGPGIGKLVFPTNEEVSVIGSIQYKGAEHKFQTTLQLKHWVKSRKVVRFCV